MVGDPQGCVNLFLIPPLTVIHYSRINCLRATLRTGATTMTTGKALSRYFVFLFLSCAAWAQPDAMNAVPQLDREKLPGRQVRVAAICIGFGGEHHAKLQEAIDQLHTVGKSGVDIACLPEEF